MNRNITYIIILLLNVGMLHSQSCPGNQGSVQWQCWRNLFEGSLTELSAHEFYPQNPDVTQTIYSLDAPINYDNYIGGRIAGYLKINTTDSVRFNMTCNEKGNFYLSTDENPANLQLIASVPAYTNLTEYDKYPSQTSAKIALDSGQYYYFELIYVESSGSDHCRISWKNSFISNTTWNVISAQYLYDIGCQDEPCPARGTPCDDGDASTSNDLEDGHCHCMGQAETANPCVGTRNFLELYRYTDISGSTLNDLYASSNFPGTPQYSAAMKVMGIPSTSGINNFGQTVSAYITVPVSGLYKFNITGDDQTALFISSNDDPSNKQANQAIVLGWSYMTEHNKYLFQNTAFIQLNAGQFYYIEVNQKQGTSSSHFGVFWQTPFTPANTWKRIPAFYFHDYNCDIACIPQGTICDDGNPFTNNDQYDENCTCVGTPCQGEDCDSPLANYTPFAACGLTDQLDNNRESSWLSCQAEDNPNPTRDRGHWIMYDLGHRYEMISSQIWNYNVMGHTQFGFELVAIDYSEDGNSWQNLGTYNWPLATGENGYGGFNGPDFQSIKARYILINSLDDTTTCRGISKVAFKAVYCPLMNTPCDDNNPNTADDKYNDNCECQGINLVANPCDEELILLQDTTLNEQIVGAQLSVTAQSNVHVEGTAAMVAGNYVELNPGFYTDPNVIFMASIAPCDTTSIVNRELLASRIEKISDASDDLPYLFVRQVEKTDFIDIYFKLDGKSQVKLTIADDNSAITYHLADFELWNKGLYRKRIRTKKLTDLQALVFRYENNGKNYEVAGVQ